MSTVWKVLIGLALVVPMGAYVAGSIAASATDDPAPRHSITIREPSGTPTPTRSSTPAPTPTRSGEPDEVEVITPSYDDLEGGGDDHSGHGGGDDHGGDDHSGHGGGDD